MFTFVKTFHSTFLSYNDTKAFYHGAKDNEFVNFYIKDNQIALLINDNFINYDETDKRFFISPNPFYFDISISDNSNKVSFKYKESFISALADGNVALQPWSRQWEQFILLDPLGKALKYPYMELHVVDHCNLGCKGCTHFCPILENRYLHDPEVIYNDMNQIARYADFSTIRILGGEPLLHPHLDLIMSFVRKAYPDSHIAVVTNGILLPAMQETFWKSLRVNNIELNVTQYPPLKNISEIDQLVKTNRVACRLSAAVKNFWKFLFLNPTSAKINDKYAGCKHKNCKILYKSRLYPCPTAAFIPIFNKKYSENIPAHPGLNIYTMTNADIVKLFSTPCATCDYCDFGRVQYFEWEKSKCDKNEWLCESGAIK